MTAVLVWIQCITFSKIGTLEGWKTSCHSGVRVLGKRTFRNILYRFCAVTPVRKFHFEA